MTFSIYTTLYNDEHLLDTQLQGQYAEPSYLLGDYNAIIGGRPVAITIEGIKWDEERDDTFFTHLKLQGLIGSYRAEDEQERRCNHE